MKKLVKIEVFNPAFGVLAVRCIKSGKKYNCDYDHFAPGLNITTYEYINDITKETLDRTGKVKMTDDKENNRWLVVINEEYASRYVVKKIEWKLIY